MQLKEVDQPRKKKKEKKEIGRSIVARFTCASETLLFLHNHNAGGPSSGTSHSQL